MNIRTTHVAVGDVDLLFSCAFQLDCYLWYCSSDTFSIHSTLFPLTVPVNAIWVMADVGDAPCQCFTPGGHQTTSPWRISVTGPPNSWIQPVPAVTIKC